MSRNQIMIALLVIIVGVGGVVIGHFALRFSQNPSTSAAEKQVFPDIPTFYEQEKSEMNNMPASSIKGDFNGDGVVSSSDEPLFMSKYMSKDPSADLDGSGQVNTLDVSNFRQLLQ